MLFLGNWDGKASVGITGIQIMLVTCLTKLMQAWNKEGIGFKNFMVEIITSLHMFCIPWVTPIFQTHYEIKNPPNLCKVCFSLGNMQGRRRMRKGEEKAWDNIQNYLATGFSICKKKKNVFPKWIAHKMLNELSIRGSLKLTIIWWKESDFFWAGVSWNAKKACCQTLHLQENCCCLFCGDLY